MISRRPPRGYPSRLAFVAETLLVLAAFAAGFGCVAIATLI